MTKAVALYDGCKVTVRDISLWRRGRALAGTNMFAPHPGVNVAPHQRVRLSGGPDVWISLNDEGIEWCRGWRGVGSSMMKGDRVLMVVDEAVRKGTLRKIKGGRLICAWTEKLFRVNSRTGEVIIDSVKRRVWTVRLRDEGVTWARTTDQETCAALRAAMALR